MYCIEGTGDFSHLSVRHLPDMYNEPGMFAALSVRDLENGAKILEGQVAPYACILLRMHPDRMPAD